MKLMKPFFKAKILLKNSTWCGHPAWLPWLLAKPSTYLWRKCRGKSQRVFHLVVCYDLSCPPSQYASGKWRFRSGSPTKDIIMLAVTVTGHGDNPSYGSWCFFGIFENPQFLMHFFCSKNEVHGIIESLEKCAEGSNKYRLKNTRTSRRMFPAPSPKGWPFSAQKNNHQMLRASKSRWEMYKHRFWSPKMVRFAQDWRVGLLKDLNQQKQLARCWKLVRHSGSTSIL